MSQQQRWHTAKGDFSQTKQPCNLVSYFNQVTDRQSVFPDYSDNIVGIHPLPCKYTTTSITKPTSPLQDKEAFSKVLTDLVRGISRPLTNKPPICLISDCCHGYSKQGERGFVFMNKHSSLQEPFNINQVEWSADFLGDTQGRPSVNRLWEGRAGARL